MPSSHSLSRMLLPKENTEPLQLVVFCPSQTTIRGTKSKALSLGPTKLCSHCLSCSYLLPGWRNFLSMWEKFYSSQSPLLPNISPLPEVISGSLKSEILPVFLFLLFSSFLKMVEMKEGCRNTGRMKAKGKTFGGKSIQQVNYCY